MAEPALDGLIEALRRLPGVGVKSAQRMAFHLLQHDREGAAMLSRQAMILCLIRRSSKMETGTGPHLFVIASKVRPHMRRVSAAKPFHSGDARHAAASPEMVSAGIVPRSEMAR